MLPLKSDGGTDAAEVSRDGTVKMETVVSAKIRLTFLKYVVAISLFLIFTFIFLDVWATLTDIWG